MRCTFYSTLAIAALFAEQSSTMVEAVSAPVATIPEEAQEFDNIYTELDTRREALADDFASQLAQSNLQALGDDDEDESSSDSDSDANS